MSRHKRQRARMDSEAARRATDPAARLHIEDDDMQRAAEQLARQVDLIFRGVNGEAAFPPDDWETKPLCLGCVVDLISRATVEVMRLNPAEGMPDIPSDPRVAALPVIDAMEQRAAQLAR